MERRDHRVARPFAAVFVGVLFYGVALAASSGCQSSSAREWAQTSPPIAPVPSSSATISLGAWDQTGETVMATGDFPTAH